MKKFENNLVVSKIIRTFVADLENNLIIHLKTTRIMAKKNFTVSRTYTVTEYTDVEAETEDEAIELAKEYGEECWEENPNDAYRDYYEYVAEEED